MKVLKQFTYKAGIREITGQKRPERASSHFQDLLFAAAKINHAFANDDIRRQWVFDMITLHEKPVLRVKGWISIALNLINSKRV